MSNQEGDAVEGQRGFCSVVFFSLLLQFSGSVHIIHAKIKADHLVVVESCLVAERTPILYYEMTRILKYHKKKDNTVLSNIPDFAICKEVRRECCTGCQTNCLVYSPETM